MRDTAEDSAAVGIYIFGYIRIEAASSCPPELFRVLVRSLKENAFDSYNEGTVCIDAMERYKRRTEHYPKRVLVDQSYRTQKNRRLCKDNGITILGLNWDAPKNKKGDRDRGHRIVPTQLRFMVHMNLR